MTIDLRDFGAKGDGQADDTQAIVAALRAGSVYESVYMPGAVYVVTAPISVTAARLVGEHHWRDAEGATVIRYEGPETDEAVLHSKSNAFQLQSLVVHANGLAQHAVKAEHCHGSACSVVNVTVTRSRGAGFVATQCSGALFDRVVALLCGGSGFVLRGCNAAVLSNVRADHCKGAGVEVIGAFAEQTWSSAGLQVRGGVMQTNQGPGVWLRGIGGMMEVGNLYIERDEKANPAPDGVRLTDCIGALVGRVAVSGGKKDGAAAYRLEGNTRNCVLDVCSSSEGVATDGGPVFSRVQHDSPLGNGNRFRDCTRNSHAMSIPLPIHDANGQPVQRTPTMS